MTHTKSTNFISIMQLNFLANIMNLIVLSLLNLPELDSFCYNKKSMASDIALQRITVYGCPNLWMIPLLKEAPCPPPLEMIYPHKHWWKQLEWDQPDAKTAPQPFCELH